MSQPACSLSTPIDEAIPFVPGFEFFYILCYILPLVPVLAIQDTGRFNRLLISFGLLNLVAFSFFLLSPILVPRPAVPGDSLAEALIRIEYSIDQPVNNFPSLHAGVAWLIVLSCRGLSRRLTWILALVATGICAGALLVKQHFVADLVAGTALAFGVFYAVEWFAMPARETLPRRRGDDAR
jgi:membrane-associated phospholipid phosphatase